MYYKHYPSDVHPDVNAKDILLVVFVLVKDPRQTKLFVKQGGYFPNLPRERCAELVDAGWLWTPVYLPPGPALSVEQQGEGKNIHNHRYDPVVGFRVAPKLTSPWPMSQEAAFRDPLVPMTEEELREFKPMGFEEFKSLLHQGLVDRELFEQRRRHQPDPKDLSKALGISIATPASTKSRCSWILEALVARGVQVVAEDHDHLTLQVPTDVDLAVRELLMEFMSLSAGMDFEKKWRMAPITPLPHDVKEEKWADEPDVHQPRTVEVGGSMYKLSQAEPAVLGPYLKAELDEKAKRLNEEVKSTRFHQLLSQLKAYGVDWPAEEDHLCFLVPPAHESDVERILNELVHIHVLKSWVRRKDILVQGKRLYIGKTS